jgi:hypothetical protein
MEALASTLWMHSKVSIMAELHAENRYDRLTSDVQKKSMSVREYVTAHREVFSTAPRQFLDLSL